MTVTTRANTTEVRMTPADRASIDRAVAASDTDFTTFVVIALTEAARLLADRTEFVLSAVASDAWTAIAAQPARDLPGVQSLLDRPCPFVDTSRPQPGP